MAYEFTHGTGTPEDPYQVWTAADLNGVRDHLESHFIQMADIDISETAWNVITGIFAGVYDGDHFTIQGLHFDLPSGSSVGLFEQVGGNNTEPDTTGVKNVCFESVNVRADTYLGAIAGLSMKATIQECSVQGTATGNGRVGGLVGENYGSIKRCSAHVTIVGEGSWPSNLGGVTGAQVSPGLLEDCYAIGSFDVNSQGGAIGGIAGQGQAGAIIKTSYAAMNVPDNAGEDGYDRSGIVGSPGHGDGITLENCYYNSDLVVVVDTPENPGATPKTTAELKDQATFDGWDFETTWAIDS